MNTRMCSPYPNSPSSTTRDRNASVEVPDTTQKNGKKKVVITAGISNGTKTEVLSGLKSGDTVILQQ